MIDLHCHLLPAVDDGARDLDEAVAMVELLVAHGFAGAAPSPHVGLGPGGDVPLAVAAERRVALAERLGGMGLAFELWPNGEHHVSVELFERLARGEVIFLGGTRWLLTELPWQGSASAESIVFRLQAKGVRPLLAHPERHDDLDVALLSRLVERGVRLQVELGSFVGLFGAPAERRAWELCERGLVHVVATDLHHLDDAARWLPAALERLRRVLGDAALALLLDANPRRLLADAPPEALGGAW